MGIKRILKDLMTLEETNISQQKYYRIKNLKKNSPIYNCIKDLKRYKVKYIDFRENDNAEYINSDNSYNYENAGFIYQYTYFMIKNKPYVNICFHRFGDVRGNYTEEVTLSMTENELLEHIVCYNYELITKNYIAYQSLLDGCITVYKRDEDSDIIGEYVEESTYHGSLETDEVRLLIDAFDMDMEYFNDTHTEPYNPNKLNLIYINNNPILIYDDEVINYDESHYIEKILNADITLMNLTNVYDYNNYIAMVYKNGVSYYIHKDKLESTDTLTIDDFKCEYYWLIPDIELKNYISDIENKDDDSQLILSVS